MDLLSIFQRLGVAVAIGFLTGVERGWKQRGEGEGARVAGLRTYTLIGLLGGVSGRLAALFDPIVLAALAAIFGLAWAYFKALETQRDNDLSITGLVAGLLVFALGAYAQRGDMHVAAAAGVLLAGVLAFKDAAHSWLRLLTWEELRSALLIFAATFIALPLLPNQALDPYGALVPRDIWLLTIVIAAVSFLGYVSLRAFGARAGLYLGAAIGALVSSTAITLDMARRAKGGEVPALQAAAAASLGNVVMFARVGALIAAFAGPALMSAAPALGGAIVTCAIAIAAMGLFKRNDGAAEVKGLASPLDLKFVLRFAALLTVITAATRIIPHFFGDQALFLLAAVAGLADVDAVALAVGGMARGGLDPHLASGAILVAAAVNTLSKVAISAAAGGPKFALPYGAISLAALGVGVAAFVLAGAPAPSP